MQYLPRTEKKVARVSDKDHAENCPDYQDSPDNRVIAYPAPSCLNEVEDKVTEALSPGVFSGEYGDAEKKEWDATRSW